MENEKFDADPDPRRLRPQSERLRRSKEAAAWWRDLHGAQNESDRLQPERSAHIQLQELLEKAAHSPERRLGLLLLLAHGLTCLARLPETELHPSAAARITALAQRVIADHLSPRIARWKLLHDPGDTTLLLEVEAPHPEVWRIRVDRQASVDPRD